MSIKNPHELLERYQRYLQSILHSRYLNLGWKLRLSKKPEWVDEFTSTLDLSRGTERSSLVGGGQMDEALQHLIDKEFKPQVVLDIGAAKGSWSLPAGTLFREAEFFMIDPLIESEESLRSICKADPRYKYILIAVGDEAGHQRMNITPDCDGSTLLDYYSGAQSSRQRLVPVATVDQLLSEGRIKPPDLVKIDVQGFEMRVLQGGLKLFDTAEVFIIETNLFKFMPECPRVHEVIAFMSERGFFLFDLAGSLRRPFENDLAQLDMVFVSAKSPMVSSNRWI